ncbi:MAG: acyl-CoA thioesterase [Chitinophagia bacterium]|jgi:acyl-CoA thioester hydrolase|nr:acyl-CoA thioesterase [Chitinophagia bacterium]
MYEHSTTVRVRYAETDRMDVVYYGNYAMYFEIGRVEAIRHLGVSYKDIEDMGIILPVVELNIKYLRPAKYDDLITIKSQIKTMPTDHKIIFDQEVYNSSGKLLTIGQVKLYFMDATMNNRTEMPAHMKEKLSVYFS